jgi:hypothetical protein
MASRLPVGAGRSTKLMVLRVGSIVERLRWAAHWLVAQPVEVNCFVSFRSIYSPHGSLSRFFLSVS